jgi:hypothetical protein
VTDIDRLAADASTGIRRTLDRLSSLVGAVIIITVLIGVATFATGMWVFESSSGWIVLGGAICLVPVLASFTAWALIRLTARSAHALLDNLRDFLGESGSAAGVLIDYDSGMALGVQARNMNDLRRDLGSRRRELPALFAGVRAITFIPRLAAIATIGMVLVGGLGTILLIGGIID